ncbi:phosphotransferase family protein, partial [Phycicoccus flavus]
DDDRSLLLSSLRGGCDALLDRGGPDQLLHGEPHPGNVLHTANGPVLIDLETCCHGPVEFDLAHAPESVALHYPELDPLAVQEARRVVLAMVASWRWDVLDRFPGGRRHGPRIVDLLRDGPPWPALGALTP